MGCIISMFDDSVEVLLCRERCSFLSEAIQHLYALSDAHTSYLLSLESVGISLHRFFSDLESASAAVPPSPVLNLPDQHEIAGETDKSDVNKHLHLPSGSHIRFRSDSDLDLSGDSPVHLDHHDHILGNSSPVNTSGQVNKSAVNKHSQSPSDSHIRFRTDSDSDLDLSGDSPVHHDHHDHISGNSSPVNRYGQVNFSNNKTLGSYPIQGSMNNPNMNINHMKKQPTTSNLCEPRPFSAEIVHMEMGETSSSSYNYPYSNNYPGYVNENPKFNNSYYGGSNKKVVGGGERSRDRGDVATFKAWADSDVIREIQFQFERASESGGKLAKILEVGKLSYKKSGAYQVSSKVLQVITPSLPRHSNQESSAIDKFDPSLLDTDQDSVMRLGNLSSTLHKLYLWEKKLCEEVKVEVKMRALYERKIKAHKVDSTRALVGHLPPKLRMAIQIAEKILVMTNELRDQVLWPQLNEVVQGLTRMWKSMYECHHIQSQAIAQAKELDALAAQIHFSDSQIQATMDLESELISWTLGFSCWVSEQKGFVRSLNNWLMRCLSHVPEETADGPVPFSPGRLGAPPIFVVCNQWAQAMDRISEKEVVDSMRDFATSILHLWERDKTEMRNRMMVSKDMERKVKDLDREDQKIHKKMQVLDKRIISGADNGLPMTGHVVYQSETSKNGSLQASLRHIFEAMERFMSNSVKAYDDLLKRIEEDRQDRLPRETQSES